jgi:rhodanese-related sulfurtransferase
MREHRCCRVSSSALNSCFDLAVAGPGEISVEDLQRRLEEKEPVAVLDVREPWEAEICSLPGSIFIPLNRLPDDVEKLPKDRLLVVLCHHGMRSRMAVDWLRAHGVENAVNLGGGIDAWAHRIDRQMKVY